MRDMVEPQSVQPGQSQETGTGHGGPALARTMGLFALVVYGVGDMVGSGIYGTVGKAAAQTGNAVWLAFLVAMVAALLTGLSYASIASRYPRAAGAAYVTHRAFHLPFLSYVVGLAVTASGLTSMATNTNIFAGNLAPFVGLKEAPWLVALGFLLLMTGLNFWGIRESMWVNLLFTAIEVGGLLFIVAVGARYWGGDVNYFETPPRPDGSAGLTAAGLLSGSVLAFFAFLGFEDMLNISEEVKDPRRTMPRGMIIALVCVALLYVSVSVTAVSVVPYKELAAAGAPLAAITAKAAPWLPRWVYPALTMFAAANTMLINYIMGSRLLYGMARQGLMPAALGRVHARRKTPHVAILALLIVVTVLALAGAVTDLAAATALLLLCCFVVVNGALVVLKRRAGEPPGGFEVPLAVPVLGAVVCGALVVARLTTRNSQGALEWKAPLIAAGLLAVIVVLYAVRRPKNVTEETLAEAELS